jgi:signal transduction histidine kinase
MRRFGLDALLAAVFAVVGEIEVWITHTYTGPQALTAVLALVRGAALLWRRSRPLTVLAVQAAASAPILLYDSAPVHHGSISETLPLVVSVYSAGAYTRGRARAGGAAIVFATAIFRAYQDAGPEAGQIASSFAFFGGILGGTWLAGLVVGRHRRRTSRAEVRASRAEAEREERAREAVDEERTRIARELHDVVAHAVSVIAVQAKGGRRMLDVDPSETRQALDTIIESAEQALTEMRRLLGMLRRSDDEVAMAPLPGLRHLDVLADQLSSAGLPVEIQVEGEPAPLPLAIDLSAYRIVQEALTNVLKHAGPASARVRVRYGARELELEIVDDGRGLATQPTHGGHGLVGMRERAALFGGRVDGGGRPGGGFAIRATLPIEGAS